MDQELVFEHGDLQTTRNNKDHQTDEIGTKRLIVRRGQAFNIHLTFKAGIFDQNHDNVSFIAETGPNPLESSGTKTIFSLSRPNIKHAWNASVITSGARSTEISMVSPPNAVIGLHTLKLQISNRSQNISHFLGEFILLFNPWCSGDAVFLDSEAERKEYVLNENGFIYMGNADWIRPQSWNFGQFDEDVIEICLKLLDRSQNCHEDPISDCGRRNDPVYVSRVISAMINSNDDNGILEGKWDGRYYDGTNPMRWNGSGPILRQWLGANFRPVRYGQCWVFAAVLCTVMRCLGIPTRVITNFESAHDTDGNLHVDEYYDNYGRMLKKETADSIWNFHVWDECWMERKDLPPGYSGWQVVDATPQEASNGTFCCGPTSVRAIKDGDVHLDYDGPFLFAEVNADIISWVVQPDSSRKNNPLLNTKRVGQRISTKSVGNGSRLDITSSYKYEEGSKEERTVFEKAAARRNSPNSGVNNTTSSSPTPPENSDPDAHSPNPSLHEVGLKMKLQLKESPVIGEDIRLALLASNLTFQNKKIDMNISAQTIQYDGKPGNLVWQETASIRLSPKAENEIPFQIPYSVYKTYLSDSHLLRVSAVGKLQDTGEMLLVEKDITLAVPNLEIEVIGKAAVDLPFTVRVSLTNTLSEEIHQCFLALEGSGVVYGTLGTELGTIKPGRTIRVSIDLTPYKPGSRQIQALFTSDKMKMIRGYKDMIVLPALGPSH
ncbi:protein-glutamine gamma-glutamyltransferase 5-like isoform X2 [Ascaphus truei]|uniref:protein-glutamine gamma-glutamyltransferase 5-like isoform X2 n=1 Tax=Ascaphus truei TaxID=8439 RepID=UPI003F59475E